MVARCSRDSWTDAGGVVAQAEAIRDRAVALAQNDGRVWEEALAALHDAQSEETSDARRDFQLEQKLEEAAAVPLEIAELGADAAALAALAGERGEGTYRADASAAAALAAGGARAAAHLVHVNLGVRPGDPRLSRARAWEQAAGESADRLLEPTR
jgi:formiminotetrahydrofolate cyclodeaminase